MTPWSVVLRGIRYRAGRSAIVLVLVALAVGVTVLAPAYARAAQQAVLAERLAAARPTPSRCTCRPTAAP